MDIKKKKKTLQDVYHRGATLRKNTTLNITDLTQKRQSSSVPDLLEESEVCLGVDLKPWK